MLTGHGPRGAVPREKSRGLPLFPNPQGFLGSSDWSPRPCSQDCPAEGSLKKPGELNGVKQQNKTTPSFIRWGFNLGKRCTHDSLWMPTVHL